MDREYATLISTNLDRIQANDLLSVRDKQKAIYMLFTQVTEDITEQERFVFTTLFSRVAYIGGKYKITPTDLHYLHLFRRANEQLKFEHKADAYVTLGIYCTRSVVAYVSGSSLPVLPAEVMNAFAAQELEVVRFVPVMEGLIVAIENETAIVSFVDEADASRIHKVSYAIADKNEIFTANIQSIAKHIELPLHANLIDVEVMENGDLVPQGLVIMPDYLKDVTSIADCFKDYGTESLLSLIGRYTGPEPTSKPILIGNVANMLLDELVADPDVPFKTLIPKIFKFNPIAISLYDDNDIREVVSKCKIHYDNIRRVVKDEAPALGFKKSMIYLEPSFFSRDYGIQGRLDLFHHDPVAKRFDIVELKSGSPFKPNIYGLSSSHYIQTLMYDLLVKSTFGRKSKPSNYILYSKLPSRSLKYAPSAKAQQYEAMKVRNDLMVLEYISAYKLDKFKSAIEYLSTDNFPKVRGFEQANLSSFKKLYDKVGPVLQDYLLEFSAFIKREQFLSKTGVHGLENSNGLAAIWLENAEEKEDRFAILKRLEIAKNDSDAEVPVITLHHSAETSELANFRVGDIAVLYPYGEYPKAVMHNQVFKCSIVGRDAESISVRLRSKQYNHNIFRKYSYWSIEEDRLDSSFNKGLRSIYDFLQAASPVQQLILGLTAPRSVKEQAEIPRYPSVTDQQHDILQSVIAAEDYYLLWGPPGTGKTSVMIKYYVKYLMEHTDQNIILMAYTNRAVDELCAAVESSGHEYRAAYLRVGSSTACDARYRDRVMNRYFEDANSRSEIIDALGQIRIVVGTVSSLANKPELFMLKSFTTAIVDEASQILEPNIVSLLTRVRKFVLVGDHKQLPAVVQQQQYERQVSSQHLIDVGITDMGMSLFERLYRQCIAKGWNQGYGVLSQQGRMHHDIVQVVSSMFYENGLTILPGIKRLTANEWAVAAIDDMPSARLVSVPSKKSEAVNYKTNVDEANKVAALIRKYQELFAKVNGVVEPSDIGVITPYRAQIALIKNTCRREGVDISKVTIDTVERYQGGARSVIILSICVNRERQFKSLVSLSTDGIDRKLNVAITRAREQIVVVGNTELMQKSEGYSKLLQECETWPLVDA